MRLLRRIVLTAVDLVAALSPGRTTGKRLPKIAMAAGRESCGNLEQKFRPGGVRADGSNGNFGYYNR